MNKNTPMILLTLIMISVAIYGKWVDGKIHETSEILLKNGELHVILYGELI